MAIPAAREPGPLVILLRFRTVAKVDSIVIWSPPSSVLHVRHGGVRSRVLRGGRGYLPPSMRQSLRRRRCLLRGLFRRSRGRESWTVLGDDDVPVEPIERYLAYLTDIERSPNTVKAYAHDLKDWFVFLAGMAWTGGRCGWRMSASSSRGCGCRPGSRRATVAVLPSVEHHCTESTVNRKLSALGVFYTHAARHGVDVGELLVSGSAAGRRGGWKPFLHHISKGKPRPRRTIALKAPKKLPRVLTAAEVQAILDGCEPAAGPVPVCPACTTPASALGRRLGCGTRISPPPNAR